MKWFVKSGLIGAAIGGGVAAMRASRRSPEEIAAGDPTPVVVAKGAVVGAGGGVAFGWIRHASATRAAARAAAAESNTSERARQLAQDGVAAGRRAADRAKPKLERARGVVSEQLHDAGTAVATTVVPVVVAAAERAVDRAGAALLDAVEAGRPVLDDALESSRGAVADAVDAARPAIESAVDDGRELATTVADGARERLAAARA